MQFSEKLKKLRAEMGVSQSELADKIYVSRSAVAKWENGLGLPSDESLAMLAEFFGVDKDELLSDPETATAIVNKNHKLSKQKLWIIALVAFSCALIILAAILLPLVLKNPPSDTNTPQEPELVQELIFETEKNIDGFNISNYADDEISTDKYFAPTRVFRYTSRNTTIVLPKILIKYTLGDQVSYVNATNVNCTVSEDCVVSYNHWNNVVQVLATDAPYSAKSEYCINLAIDDMRLSLKIRQEAIQVESIKLEIESSLPDTVYPNSENVINTKITPYDATYQAVQYSIDRILDPNGVRYTGTFSQYAYLSISNNVYLHTTANIDVGAKIYVYAIAEKDQVRSNMLEVEVIRNEIRDITFESTNDTDCITVGKLFWFKPIALDEDATFNIKNEKFDITLLTPDLAKIEYSKGLNRYSITATDDVSKIGEKIEVFVTTPEGFSKTFSWTIAGIPVEQVIIVNADTDEEINEEFTVAKGEILHFKIKVLPENASYEQKEFKYVVNNSNRFEFSEDGDILTVTVLENAHAAMTEEFYASVLSSSYPYQTVTSSVYTITVEGKPIESIILKADRDTLIKGGGPETYAVLTFEIFPADAEEIWARGFSWFKSAPGVELKHWTTNDRLYIGADITAIGGSEVIVSVQCNLVKSNTLTLTVQNVPVEEVELGIESLSVVKGKAHPLNLKYNLGADPQSVQFKLLDEVEGVDINSNNLLCIHKTAIVGAKFRVQAIVDGIESNILNLEVIDSPSPDDIIELAKSEFYKLNELFYIDADLFILPYGTDESQLKIIGSHSLVIFASAPTGMIFQARAIVDGVVDRVFTFKVIDNVEPEEMIEIGGRFAHRIYADFYPDIDKNLVEFILLDEIDESYIKILDSNILYLSPTAPSGLTFRLLAVVDGVPDRIITYKVI